MSDYLCVTRSNYFSVTDVEELKMIVEKIASDGQVHFFEKEERYGFGCYGSVFGLIVNQGTEDEDVSFDEMCSKLQGILADDDAIIITETGHRKLQDVDAVGVIITKNQVVARSLSDHLLGEARRILNNDEFATQMSD